MEYQEGKVYKIEGDGLTYYGSTTTTLNERFSDHKCNQHCCSSRQIIELGHATIVLVELFPCETLDELLWRERWYIENNECVNINLPILSEEERKNKSHNHYINNKEKHNKMTQQWYSEHKKEHNEITQQHYIDNKEKTDERHRQYNLTHKKENAERHSKKYTCECGSICAWGHKSSHEKTLKHKLFEKNKNLCIVHVSVESCPK
jgi:hypothetical protein